MYGCAWGGAMLAMGRNETHGPHMEEFPWIRDAKLLLITNMYHMVLNGSITLEKLAQVVDSWTPEEHRPKLLAPQVEPTPHVLRQGLSRIGELVTAMFV